MNLITRLDFDGIVCAALITEMETIPEINFSDPKTIDEGGLLDILQPGDVLAHLPFHPDAGMWFHNHDTSHIDPNRLAAIRGKWGVALSASQQVYDFYHSERLKKYEPLVEVANRLGSANLTKEDILSPKGWMLVAYTLDPRFSFHYAYGMTILNAVKGGKSADEVLAIPEVAHRVELYLKDEENQSADLSKYTRLDGNVIITDYREVDRPMRGNRFYVFTQYPEGNIHMRLDSAGGMRVKVSVSKNIFNRTSKVNVGRLMEQYGGGGPEGAGTCYIGKRVAEERIAEIVGKLKD